MPPSALTGFNRTFMELKAHGGSFICCTYRRFNRTFMELKVVSIMVPGWKPASFNRTFMELKATTNCIAVQTACVSIAPLWN